MVLLNSTGDHPRRGGRMKSVSDGGMVYHPTITNRLHQISDGVNSDQCRNRFFYIVSGLSVVVPLLFLIYITQGFSYFGIGAMHVMFCRKVIPPPLLI